MHQFSYQRKLKIKVFKESLILKDSSVLLNVPWRMHWWGSLPTKRLYAFPIHTSIVHLASISALMEKFLNFGQTLCFETKSEVWPFPLENPFHGRGLPNKETQTPLSTLKRKIYLKFKNFYKTHTTRNEQLACVKRKGAFASKSVVFYWHMGNIPVIHVGLVLCQMNLSSIFETWARSNTFYDRPFLGSCTAQFCS